MKIGEIVKIENKDTYGNEKNVLTNYYGIVIHNYYDMITVIRIDSEPFFDGSKKDISKEKAEFYDKNEKIDGWFNYNQILSISSGRVKRAIGRLKTDFVTSPEKGFYKHLGTMCENKEDVCSCLKYILSINFSYVNKKKMEMIVRNIEEFIDNCDMRFKEKFSEHKKQKPGDVFLIHFGLGSQGNEITKKRYGVVVANDVKNGLMNVIPISSVHKEQNFHMKIDNSFIWNVCSATDLNGTLYPEQIKCFDKRRCIKYNGHIKHSIKINLMQDLHRVNFIYVPLDKVRPNRPLSVDKTVMAVNSLFKGFITENNDDFTNARIEIIKIIKRAYR